MQVHSLIDIDLIYTYNFHFPFKKPLLKNISHFKQAYIDEPSINTGKTVNMNIEVPISYETYAYVNYLYENIA